MKTNLLWHAEQAHTVLQALDADQKNGLSQNEYARRLSQFGYNTLKHEQRFQLIRLIWNQLKSPLIFILIIAGGVTFALGEHIDTIVIALAVLINTVIGIVQEGRASKAFEKLQLSLKRYAVVIRDGYKQKIETQYLVPGDIVILQSGNQVPADIRLIETNGTTINEAVLTGEWLSVEKQTDPISQKQRITEQTNIAWMGTLVDDGWAKGVVVATGEQTEFGRIAGLLAVDDDKSTPFQQGVARLARIIGIAIAGIIAAIFFLGISAGLSITEMFLIGVALAVSAIPEGLPVAVTVILAISMSRILKKGGLVKKLVSAETLGSTTVILTDKTGTLTQARMSVAHIIPAYEALNKHTLPEDTTSQYLSALQKEILTMSILTTNVFLEKKEADQEKQSVQGQPTEKALAERGIEENISPEDILRKRNRLDFMPFDAERRFAASLHTVNAAGIPVSYNKESNILFLAGAFEQILSLSTSRITENGTKGVFTDKEKHDLTQTYMLLANRGMRIIAVAYQETDHTAIPRSEFNNTFNNLVFAGFIALHDPVRDDVLQSIHAARSAGLRPIMVTGDYKGTALSVARQVGLVTEQESETAIDGKDIEHISDIELKKLLYSHSVFARILPHQKMQIAKILHKENEIVAMTGDGVNDAPALRAADIGIALNSGTDVAKEASEMILVKDSFRVIVDAIREGRIALENLRKVTTYLLSTGFSEVILISTALLFGAPLPVLPAQILWANIVQEGFMNFALAFEPGESNVMKRNPKFYSARKIITQEMGVIIFVIGISTSALLGILLFFLLQNGYPIEEIRTIMFAGISVDALFFIFALKSFQKSIWQINIFSNRYLIAAFFVSLLFLVGALTLPPLQTLLRTTTPTLTDILIIVGLGIADLFAIELAKWYYIKKFAPKAHLQNAS